MGGYAWVTLATNDSYSLGAMVLAHSLRRVGTKHDLVILVSPGVTAVMRERLAEVFSLVKEVNLLDSKDKTNLSLLARPELGVTFTKIHCWRLTQYEKCVFLDADTLVVKNCDELFDREELSAAPDVGWPDCFNSGVFVFKPSEETYDSIAAFAVAKGSFDGGDQGLLNMYFSDWAWKDISKHLPFIYNMCSMATYSYLPAFKQFGEDVRIIHFIGKTKPWLQHFDTLTGLVHPSGDSHHLRPLLQLWWSIFVTNVHPQLSPVMAGLAGALAQMKLGEARSPEQIALEEHMRKQSWEEGHVDYMGRDSFDNIWKKISETLSLAPQRQPTPPKDEPEPEETVKEATATSLEKKEEDVRQAEEIDESVVDASLISKTPVENVAAERRPVTTERPVLLGQTESRQDLAENGEIPGIEQPVPPQTLLEEKENVPVDAGKTEELVQEKELSSATMDKGLRLEVSVIPVEKVVEQKDTPVVSTESSESCSITARNLGQQQVVAVPNTALVKAMEQTVVSAIPEQRADKTSQVEKEVIKQVYALPDIPPKETALVKARVIAQESPKPDLPAKSSDFQRQFSERIALAAETTSASPVPIQVAESVLQTEPKTALESREGDLASEEAISTVIAPVCDIATQSAEILHENQPCQVPAAAVACNGSGRLELEKDLLGPQEASQTVAQASLVVEPRSEEKLLTETSAQGRVVAEDKTNVSGSIAESRETRQEETTTTSKLGKVQDKSASGVPKGEVKEEVTVEASKVPVSVPTEVKGTKSEQSEVVKPEETVEKELKAEEKKSVTTMCKSEPKEEPKKEEEVVVEAKVETAKAPEAEAVKTPEAEVAPCPASRQQPEKPERSSRTKDQPDTQAKSTKKTTKKLTTKKSSEGDAAEGTEDVEKKTTKKLTKKSPESETADGAEDVEKKATKKVVKKVPKKPKEGQEEGTESSSSGEKPKKPVKLTKKSSKSGQTQEAEASAPETTPDAPVPPKRKVKTTAKSAKPEAE